MLGGEREATHDGLGLRKQTGRGLRAGFWNRSRRFFPSRVPGVSDGFSGFAPGFCGGAWRGFRRVCRWRAVPVFCVAALGFPAVRPSGFRLCFRVFRWRRRFVFLPPGLGFRPWLSQVCFPGLAFGLPRPWPGVRPRSRRVPRRLWPGTGSLTGRCRRPRPLGFLRVSARRRRRFSFRVLWGGAGR